MPPVDAQADSANCADPPRAVPSEFRRSLPSASVSWAPDLFAGATPFSVSVPGNELEDALLPMLNAFFPVGDADGAADTGQGAVQEQEQKAANALMNAFFFD